jgi:malonate transporter
MVGNASILGSLVPVFLIILLGYGLQKTSFPGDSFWPGAERLIYFLLFPALLFSSTAKATWELHSIASMVWAVLLTMFVITVLLIILRTKLTQNDKAFTSLFQGSIRFTTYIGLAAVFALFGDSGLQIAAVLITILIPLVNILSVMVLVRFGGQQNGWHWIFKSVARNPLIIACVLGMAFNLTGLGMPVVLGNFIGILGRASLPLGLLAVGASMQLTTIKKAAPEVVKACLLKLVLLPGLMWVACYLFQADKLSTAIAVLFGALPGSPLSYILAKQLGGDSKLMATIVTVQTGVSMFTLPVVVALVTM